MKSFKFSVALAAFIVLGYTGFAQQPTVQQLIIQVSKGWQADAKKALPDLLLDKPDDPAVMFLHATLVDDPKRALPLYERIIERFPAMNGLTMLFYGSLFFTPSKKNKPNQ